MLYENGTEHDSTAYRLGLRCDFSVNPLQFYFYGRGKGFANPGTYYNGSENDLIENPASVVEDFLRNSVGLVDANLDQADFTSTYSARDSWKLALAIFSEE